MFRPSAARLRRIGVALGLAMLASVSASTAQEGPGLTLSIGPRTCSENPDYCDTPEEKAEAERKMEERARAFKEEQAARKREAERKAAEVKAITDQIGAHRAAEAERLLKMQEAANEASLAQKKSAHEQSCKARIARGLQNLCECAEYYPNKLKNATVCAQ